jgi:hypothetical protein
MAKKLRPHTIQFYTHDESVAEEYGDHWPKAHLLVAHATIGAHDHEDAVARFARTTNDPQPPGAGPWWIDGQVTVRTGWPLSMGVRERDVLAVGRDSEVTLWQVQEMGPQGGTWEQLGSGFVPESSSVFTVHQEEQRLEAERRQLLAHYEHRSTSAETATEHALDTLLDACGELAAAFLRDQGLPPGMLERDHPKRERLVGLLRIASELVATLPCPNLHPGDCQQEIRYIAHRAGVEGDLVAPNGIVTGHRVPIYDDPPRHLDMRLEA